jgi:hypothetical protein
LHNSGIIIYDDGSTNYSGGFTLTDGTTPWNCGRQFLFTEYTGVDVSLTFTYDGSITPEPGVDKHNIIITNLTTGTIFSNTFPSTGGSGPVLDENLDGSLRVLTLNSTTPGEYQIQYFRPGQDPTTGGIADITGRVVLQPQIQKFWIEATPICSNFSGTQYNFQMHAYPEFAAQMVHSGTYGAIGGGLDCADGRDENYISFSFSLSGTPYVINHATWLRVATPTPISGDEEDGALWNPTSPVDFNDLYINNSDLAPYLTGSSVGTTPVISITFSDGIGTPMIATAPIIIEFPPSTIYPGDPTTTPSYFTTPTYTTGAETGTPGPSYNMYDYTVTGNETWTTTDNPITRMQDDEITVSTIRIQDNLKIQPGATLNLNGVTLEMGPGSYADINNSTSTAVAGGRLVMTNATLTSYHDDCNSATDMWGGVRLWGNQVLGQSPAGGSPQGSMLMTGSTVSYAQTGIALGTPGTLTTLSIGGGGIIQAINSTFYNNNTAVQFTPYCNIVGGTEYNNLSSFRQCSFHSDDISTVPSGTLYDIKGGDVKGIGIYACNFYNGIASTVTSYAIYGNNMGFNVGGILTSPVGTITIPCTFSNFYTAIYHGADDASHTANISHSTFTNNLIGINLNASIAPFVTNCTFNVPYLAGISSSPYLHTPIQSIGLFLNAANLYTVFSNTFQFYSTARYVSPTLNKTVGVLAYNTQVGSDEHVVHNNTYKGLGTANLSNYKNFDLIHGLWFKCNNETNNLIDIAAEGSNPLYYGDGMRILQGLTSGSHYGGVYYANGLPSGNTFSSGSVLANLSSSTGNYPYTYVYNAISGAPVSEDPTIHTTGVTVVGDTYTGDQCALPGALGTPTIGNATTTTAGIPVPHHRPAAIDPNDNSVNDYMAVLYNINYYMSDSDGVTHRDSLYYWVGQVPSAAGDLAKANLLLEDGYADSATVVYDSIHLKYSLDSTENLEFSNSGSELFNIKKRIISYYANINQAIAAAQSASLNVDSVLHADSAELFYPVLDGPSLTSLVHIFDSSRSWAHLGAESILAAYAPDTLKSMLTVNPDTLLFPTITDGTVLKSNPGVLAVTEISQGPSIEGGGGGCQYAEMIVANCGTDAGDYSDVSGWIVDDNSGNFDTSGCTAGNAGINRGHYRLNPDNVLWQNIKVGTVLVMYNAAVNCYGLPDTMKIDSTNGIVYLPVPGTPKAYLQRYAGIENASASSYCSDTGTTVYDTATAWATTMNLDAADGLQVRCPGCTTASPGSPAFYHGIAYAPDVTYCMNGDTATAGSPGAALVLDNSSYQKYVFTGSNLNDFANAAKWTTSSADEAGNPPSSLGYVDSTLYSLVTLHSLSMPCCGTGGDGMGERKANTTATPGNNNTINKVLQGIRVYPNPASMTLNFEFPASGNVSIKLMDVTGRVLDERVITTGTMAAFDVKGYAAGLYLYQVITAGNTQSGKFIVK